MESRRPDSPEIHPGGGNPLFRNVFIPLWLASQRAGRAIPTWNGVGVDGLSQRRNGERASRKGTRK